MTSLMLARNRNTFGLYDPLTKERYSDIISAHLQARRIYRDELFDNEGKISESQDRQKEYKLLLDNKALNILIKEGELAAMISFQVRTDGCFAVTRIFNDKIKQKAIDNEQ